MGNSDFELKGRKLKREEALLLLLSALAYDDIMKDRVEFKDGKFALTQSEMTATLVAFARKIVRLYDASLNREIADSIVAKEKRIIADMEAAGINMDCLLNDCEQEEEPYNKEEEYGDDNQH